MLKKENQANKDEQREQGYQTKVKRNQRKVEVKRNQRKKEEIRKI